MTKADLVEQVYEAIGPGITKKDCGAVVDAFLNATKGALAEGKHIEIRGFGTFKVRHRKSRMARNPRTGDSVRVPARSVPVFKPSRLFKEEVAARAQEQEAAKLDAPTSTFGDGSGGGFGESGGGYSSGGYSFNG